MSRKRKRSEYGGRGWEQGPEDFPAYADAVGAGVGGDAADSGADGGVGTGARAGRAGRGSGRMGLFLRSTVADFLLTWALSAALTLTVSFAFQSVPELRGDVALVAALELPLLLVLFAGSWSRRSVPLAAVGAIVYAVVVGVMATQLTPPGVPLFTDGWLNDEPGNYLPFACVLVVVPLLVYLLSRRTVGLAFLLLATIVACAWVQFLYRDWAADNHGTIIAVTAFACVAMLFVYQTYKRSILGAQRAKRASFAGAAVCAGAVALVCVGVAVAVFYAVVAPLQLSTADIKPFQRYYARPVIEYSGVFDRQQTENQDQTTDDTNDEMEDTNQDAEGNDNQNDGQQSPAQAFLSNVFTQVATTLNPNSWTQQFDGISYEQLRLGAFAMGALVLAAVAAAVLARRSVRERRLRKMAGDPRAQQVQKLYAFLLERFRRLKMPKPPALTPMEFALVSQRTMEPFVAEPQEGAAKFAVARRAGAAQVATEPAATAALGAVESAAERRAEDSVAEVSVAAQSAETSRMQPEAEAPAQISAQASSTMTAREAFATSVDTSYPVTFVRVTDIYQRSSYGAHPVTDQELADVQRYYRAFFKNARRYTGNLRWIWKFWRI